MNLVKAAIAKKRGLSLPDESDELGSDVSDESLDDEGGGEPAPSSSLARAGAPTPDIKPMAPSAAGAITNDLDKQQQALNKIRQGTREANYQTNIGQALSHLAMGTQTPTSSDDLYKSMEAQNKEASTEAGADLTRRANVMKAIQQAKLRQDIAGEQIKSREGVAQENRLSREELARQHNETLGASKSAAADLKQTGLYNQAATALETMRGNPAVQQAEKDVYAAQKANSLLKIAAPDGDLNKVTPQMAALLRNEVGKIATGGVPGVHELDALDPKTLAGSMASVWQKLSNEPTPENAGAFLKQYKDYADSLTKDAKGVITDRYGRIINTRKSQLTDDQAKTLEDNYINRFTHEADAGSKQSAGGGFPKTVKNGTHEAVVNNQQEADEAAKEGFK